MEKLNKLNNNGYSLVELIVAMLVSAVVMLAAVGFMASASGTYQSIHRETTLQTEAQIAINQISNILLEAKEYEFLKVNDNDSIYSVLYIECTDKNYMIAYIPTYNQLLVKSQDIYIKDDNHASLDKDKILETINKDMPKEKCLLANYITEFQVSPTELSSDNGLVKISLKLQIDEQEYSTSLNISLRNQG